MMLRKDLLCADYSKQLDVDNRLLAVAQHLQAQCVTDERFNQFAEYMIFRMSRKIYIIRDKQFIFLLSVTIDNILAETCKNNTFGIKY